MDKVLFRMTEKKLYNYYQKDKKINSIKRKIELLKRQILEIDRKLRTTDISIPEESRSISYEERVQSSSDGTSYAERSLMKIIDNLENEKIRKNEEIAFFEEELRTIESDNAIIDSNISFLDEESKSFLKTKYSKRIADWEIALKTNASHSKVYRTRANLVEDVARWEDWLHTKKVNKK